MTSTASGFRTERGGSDEAGLAGRLSDRGTALTGRVGAENASFLKAGFEPVKKPVIFCQSDGVGALAPLPSRSEFARPERPSPRFLEPRREPRPDCEGW